MKRVMFASIGLIVFLGLLAQANAQQKKQLWTDPAGTFRPPSPSEEKAIVTNLELTEEQQSEMKKLSQSYRADVQELADRYQKARQDLVAALQIGNPDPARVSDEVKRVHQTHSTLVEKEANYWIALASILTKDQAIEFWKLFAKSRIMRGKGGSED